MQNYENISPFFILDTPDPQKTKKHSEKYVLTLWSKFSTTKKAIHTDYFINIIQHNKFVDF